MINYVKEKDPLLYRFIVGMFIISAIASLLEYGIEEA
ncbi:MAG: hypothetical protein K0R09_2359 [Clostridiales bacterium]|nr:hypothetical protein [Clostridiales bacterium]